LSPPARRALLREVAAVLRAVHALDAGGLRSAGLPPVTAGAAGLRARLEPNFADLVENLTSRPDRWPLDVAPSRVAEMALAANSRRVRVRRRSASSSSGADVRYELSGQGRRPRR
jgi:hypothetical protein